MADVSDAPLHEPLVLCVGETMMAISPVGTDLTADGPVLLEPAGGESNVAANLTGLGHRAMWASRVGNDAIGRRVLASLTARGVDVSLVECDPDHRTGLMVKGITPTGTQVTYYRDGSAASYLSLVDVARLGAVKPRIAHVSGVTSALSHACDGLMTSLVQKRALGDGCMVSLDVNFRPQLWTHTTGAARRLAQLANAADVVFVGLDEAHELWGCRQPADVRTALPRPRHLVVKDGPRAAVELAPSGSAVTASPQRCRIVEAVGAGDAFAAGWLAGYLRGGGPRQRLALGHLLARTALVTAADVGSPPDPGDVAAVWNEAAVAGRA